jgi:hypothetical protein
VRRARGAAERPRRARARAALAPARPGARERRRAARAPRTFVLREPEDYPPRACRCGRPRRTRSRRRRLQRRGARHVRGARAFSTVHEGAVYRTSGAPTRSPSSTSTRRTLVKPFTGTWSRSPRRRPTPGSRSCSTSARACGVKLSFGRRRGHETVMAYQRKKSPTTRSSTCRRSTCPRRRSARRRSGTSCPRRSAKRTSRARTAARRAARRGALADRRAPAAGHVRPLGHRRPVDQRAPADRRADDLHLRRPPRRRRHHAPGLPRVRDARRRRAPPRRECPCESGCPRACSRPSAATSTSRCPRRARSR